MSEDFLDVSVKQDGGVHKKILREGSGSEHPAAGDEVEVHYVGTLEADGSKFDSSRDRGDTFKFKLGKGQVIKGWDEGVATMRKGELAMLKIRSDYGYGASGSGEKIPGGATLMFEVELISWSEHLEKVTADGGIRKRTLVEGEKSWEHPTYDEKVTISYALRVAESGKEVEKREGVQFVVGEEAVRPFIEQAVMKMAKGEKALVKIAAKDGFGAEGNAELGVAGGAALEAEVEVTEYEKLPSSWELEDEVKVSEAARIKDEGNELFKAGRMARAERKYERALRLIEYDSSFSQDIKARASAIKLSVHLNLAAVFLKQAEYSKCVEHSTKALEIDKNNAKGLFRRGKAFSALSDFERAKKDLLTASKIEPSDKAVISELAILKKKIDRQDRLDHDMYSRMIGGK